MGNNTAIERGAAENTFNGNGYIMINDKLAFLLNIKLQAQLEYYSSTGNVFGTLQNAIDNQQVSTSVSIFNNSSVPLYSDTISFLSDNSSFFAPQKPITFSLRSATMI